jgi:hypothetical protein
MEAVLAKASRERWKQQPSSDEWHGRWWLLQVPLWVHPSQPSHDLLTRFPELSVSRIHEERRTWCSPEIDQGLTNSAAGSAAD